MSFSDKSNKNRQRDRTQPADTGPQGGSTKGGLAVQRANPEWEFRLIAAACVVGAALVIVGLWGEIAVRFDGILSTTFIVSGLALVFGAFGAQAVIRYKSWVVAGTAAIALIFLFAIDHLRQQSIVIIDMWVPHPGTEIELDKRIPGILERKETPSSFWLRYHVLYRQIEYTSPAVITKWPNPSLNETKEPLEANICITRDKITPWFGRGRHAEWRVKAEHWEDPNMEIRDNRGNLIGTRKECGSNYSIASISNLAISSAHAEVEPDINSLLNDLLSDDADVRRLARDQLADLGARAIRPMMDKAISMTASRDRLAFRMQLGTAVAIDTMLNKKGRTISPRDVAQHLNANDFAALVNWTLNDDRSLRGPALRIFASTADVPALRQLMQSIERENDEDIIYNTAWILRQSAQRYRGQSDRTRLEEIKQLARSLRPRAARLEKTTDFLKQIEDM
jgi:hypothetical protein